MQRADRTTGARAATAADIAPGKSRLNVLAGRRAAVNGHVVSGLAGRRVLLQRQSGRRLEPHRPRHHARRRGVRLGGRPGSAQLRVLVDAARRKIGRLNVYGRAAVCGGPGATATRLGLGGRLTPGTLGVARECRAGRTWPARGRPHGPRARRRPWPARGWPRFDLPPRPVPACTSAAWGRCSSPAERRAAGRQGRGVAREVDHAASRASTAGHRAPRLRLVLRERRAAAPAGAARPAGRGRRQRARAVVPPPATRPAASACSSAMSAVRARRLCPHAIFLPPDFKAYSAKSQRGSGTSCASASRARCRACRSTRPTRT